MRKNVVTLMVMAIATSVIVYAYMEQTKVEKALVALQANYSNTRFELLDKQEEQRYVLKTEGESIADSLVSLLPENTCILRIHNGGCLSCYAQNVIHLYQLVKDLDIPFAVLGTYSTRRQFKGETAGLIPTDSVFNVNVDCYGFLPADSIDKPYLFVIRNGEARQVYILNKNGSETLKLYVKSLIK